LPSLNDCIVCGSHITYPLYAASQQPLVSLRLPQSQQQAQSLGTLDLDFHMCANCSHVYNRSFDEACVPYTSDANLMYNASPLWQEHLQQLLQKIMTTIDLKGKTVVEIGCGDGHFLHELKRLCPQTNILGFEPSSEAETARTRGIECQQDYFIAARDLARYRPDVIISRHVVEHLSQPRQFMTEMSFEAVKLGLKPLVVIEVPRVDKALQQVRINDFFYEHVSHFTLQSFRKLFEISGYHTIEIVSSYDDEVLISFSYPCLEEQEVLNIQKNAHNFQQSFAMTKTTIHAKLNEYLTRGKSIAFWGGTSKGASFLNAYDLDAAHFPLVVDSDNRKIGFYVPGTGQQIRSPQVLLENPTDIIVITTFWRVKDIYREIQQRQIPHQEVLAIQNQQLLTIGSQI